LTNKYPKLAVDWEKKQRKKAGFQCMFGFADDRKLHFVSWCLYFINFQPSSAAFKVLSQTGDLIQAIA